MELKVVCNCKVVCNIGKWCAILESGVQYWKVACNWKVGVQNIGKWSAIGKSGFTVSSLSENTLVTYFLVFEVETRFNVFLQHSL